MGEHATRGLLSGLTVGCALIVGACQGPDETAASGAAASAPARPAKPDPAPVAAPTPEHGSLAQRRKAYLEGCEDGDGQACFALGEMVDEGVGGPQEPRRARALYEQACAFGSEEACDALGH